MLFQDSIQTESSHFTNVNNLLNNSHHMDLSIGYKYSVQQ